MSEKLYALMYSKHENMVSFDILTLSEALNAAYKHCVIGDDNPWTIVFIGQKVICAAVMRLLERIKQEK